MNIPVVMIGSANERNLGEAIEAGVSRGKVINLIGRTHLREVFHLLRGAQLLLGCDSAPMHMAGLTNTPCLNLSFDAVNFWETGPKSNRSFVYKVAFPEDVLSEQVGIAIDRILKGESPENLIQRSAGLASYADPDDEENDLFAWNLVQALYLGESYPVTDDIHFCQAIEKLNEVNNLSCDHIRQIPDKGLVAMAPLLERGDEVMLAIARISPAIGPLIKWYQTEKLRIPPGSREEVSLQTLKVHEKLRRVLSVYMLDDSIRDHEPAVKD